MPNDVPTARDYEYLLMSSPIRPLGTTIEEVAKLIDEMRKKGFEPCNAKASVQTIRAWWGGSRIIERDPPILFRRRIHQQLALPFI